MSVWEIPSTENKLPFLDNKADSEIGCGVAVCWVLPWRAEYRQHEHSRTNH